MMLEAKIEEVAIRELERLAMPAIRIDGLWTPAPFGKAKSCEGADFVASLGVVAAPRTFENFSSVKARVVVALALRVRQELCPTAYEFASMYAMPVVRLLQTWQLYVQTVKSTFSVSVPESHGFSGETFVPSGFLLEAGVAEVDKETKTWTVSHSFVLRGIVSQTPRTTSTPKGENP